MHDGRLGGWKVVQVGKKRDQFQLYNILKDNEERDELSAQYPERLESLKAILLSQIDSDRPDL
ncbi:MULTISPECIES: hypothetical protein [unclassified Lentimonas]|nr:MULTISPECIES: hypothetical protein [unclassified Lentimonas]CAA6692720.1 Unannotated [Lentimonas sp. CC10]CAA6696714.1 Unannotated [Lentimonas sp. CC19]CAA7072306.1 Unannotated [Lentimonas sp. CC11]